MNDHALLHRYAHEGAQDAFGELVQRHLDLVYSAAKRQVRSPQLAEEVAQTVFVDLARHAAKISPDQPLAAWLYVVTRRTAIDVVRREARRTAREQAAGEIASMNSTVRLWPRVEPLLDEAMASLGDVDRRAVLLRFFENKSLREVGTALGTTDDAAQKRVTRALEHLRAFFLRRGIAVASAALAADLSAHAITAAPAGLSALIAASTPVASVAGAIAWQQAAPTIAMTTTQKIVVAAMFTLALGAGLYEASVIVQLKAELKTLRAESQRALDATRENSARQLAAVEAQLAAERAKTLNALAATDPAMEAALDTWLQNVLILKRLLDKVPASKIPELQLLTANDWLDAAKDLKSGSEVEARRALSKLRLSAKQRFLPSLHAALKRHLEATANQPPTEAMQLAPYIGDPNSLAILQRYGVVSAGQSIGPVDRAGKEQWILREKTTVDDYYDSTLLVGSRGAISAIHVSRFGDEVRDAVKAYQAASNGQRPTAAAQLTPYLRSAIDPAFVQEQLGKVR
ncbi:MAG: sigma-70 family RNA polymerase sigma factor [Opitutae bacterium]|nr:sigma-70 family RNA polymerase sigma factor [Opitutae bacterium]